jgi:hypothetical protein
LAWRQWLAAAQEEVSTWHDAGRRGGGRCGEAEGTVVRITSVPSVIKMVSSLGCFYKIHKAANDQILVDGIHITTTLFYLNFP